MVPVPARWFPCCIPKDDLSRVSLGCWFDNIQTAARSTLSKNHEGGSCTGMVAFMMYGRHAYFWLLTSIGDLYLSSMWSGVAPRMKTIKTCV